MNNRTITVFEHERLQLGSGKRDLSSSELDALNHFYGSNGLYYYSLIYEGVKFNSYVGVIQVGKLTIEILPKADRYPGSETDVEVWQPRLLAMLKAVGLLPLHTPSSSNLQLKANSLLDLYFTLFVDEVARLMRTGLVKQYRKTESNSLSLKGKLLVNKNIQKNFAHQEKTYVSHTIYDTSNSLNGILYHTLQLLQEINSNTFLQSRISAMLLNFPEQERLSVSEALFNRILFNRKVENYRSAINIARLILLNYHPDVQNGKDHVLAILFDMNFLWERFVFRSLILHKAPEDEITAQNMKPFWQPNTGSETTIRPDIVIIKNGRCAVLDTKWKNLTDANPSANDLRQMYVYHHYYKADKAALVYPGKHTRRQGHYFENNGDVSPQECALLFLSPTEDTDNWQKVISDTICEWLASKKT